MTMYAGLDVSDKTTHICVTDGEGAVIRRDVVLSGRLQSQSLGVIATVTVILTVILGYSVEIGVFCTLTVIKVDDDCIANFHIISRSTVLI